MGHAQHQALLEAAVLALVAALLLDFTASVTAFILQLHPDGPPEKALHTDKRRRRRSRGAEEEEEEQRNEEEELQKNKEGKEESE